MRAGAITVPLQHSDDRSYCSHPRNGQYAATPTISLVLSFQLTRSRLPVCRYVMIVHTPRLCGEAVFLEGHDTSQEPSSTIECRPVVKKIRESVDPPSPPEPRQPLLETPLDAPPAWVETVGESGGGEGYGSILDGVDLLTLVYDPETGAIESAVTEGGEEVFAGSELRRQLDGEGGGRARNEDPATTIQGLEDLAKIVSYLSLPSSSPSLS
jgi:hypothetical protein